MENQNNNSSCSKIEKNNLSTNYIMTSRKSILERNNKNNNRRSKAPKKMHVKILLYYIMINENKKEYFKNYRLKNREKINEYQRQQYYIRKNKKKEINDNIKKDVEKLKKNFRLLHGYSEHDDINILIIATR